MVHETLAVEFGSLSKQQRIDQVATYLEALFPVGQVWEVRIPKVMIRNYTASYRGYFDDIQKLAKAVAAFEGKAESIYCTINPVNAALLARAYNTIEKAEKNSSTSDEYIDRRVYIPIDVDPVRPSGISSTDAEHEAALARADQIREYLALQGWPEPVMGDSGNGAHLLYPIDLPNDNDSRLLIEDALAALHHRFGDDTVKIDTTTSNAARVWKVYGTLAAKGSDMPDRPHRWAKLLSIPPALIPVPVDLLRHLAAESPHKIEEKPSMPSAPGKALDMEAWLQKYGITYTSKSPWRGGTLWVLDKCHFSPDHTDGAWVAQFPSGAVDAGCHHDRCKGKGWRELREMYEGPREPYSPPEEELPELTDDEIVEVIDEYQPLQHSAWPYGFEGGALVRYFKAKDGEIESEIVAHFTAAITQEILDEDGSKSIVIQGHAMRGGAFQTEVEATLFGHDARLRAALESAAGALDPVRPDMAKHLGPAIKLLTKDDELTQIRRFKRTGWTNNIFLIPGREPPNTRIELPAKLPYKVGRRELDPALQALESLILSVNPNISTPIIAMLLQAPLHRLAGWHNERYAIFVQGRTGSLKTSFTQTAMCIYGDGFLNSDILIKWGEGATRNAIMAMATSASDMPLLIDNYKPNTGGGGRDFVNLIHNILEGGEKDRLSRASELRETKPIHCFPLITGEDIPSTDPASLARVLVIPFEWQRGEINERLSFAQEHSGHLQAIGDYWLAWLECEEGQAVAAAHAIRLAERRALWAAFLRENKPDMVNILRVATNLAVNELTWHIAQQHPQFGYLFSKYVNEHVGGLRSIALAMTSQTTETLEAHRFLAVVRELLASGRAILVPRSLGTPTNNADKERMLGWSDSDGAYLLPQLTLQVVKSILGPGELLISPQTLYAQLDGLGLLATKGSNETTKFLKVDGRSQRVLHLMPHALDNDYEANDDDLKAMGLDW